MGVLLPRIWIGCTSSQEALGWAWQCLHSSAGLGRSGIPRIETTDSFSTSPLTIQTSRNYPLSGDLCSNLAIRCLFSEDFLQFYHWQLEATCSFHWVIRCFLLADQSNFNFPYRSKNWEMTNLSLNLITAKHHFSDHYSPFSSVLANLDFQHR